MIKYKYSALDENSEIINGELEAENEEAVVRILTSEGKKPIKINADVLSGASKQKTLKKISIQETAVFCKQLSIITRSGISITKGLMMVRNQAKDKKVKELAENLYTEIQKGSSLSEAFKNSGYRLPLLLINMVRVGEASGNLDEIFKKVSEYFEKECATRKKVISALIYPSILICVSISVIILFAFFILPSMIDIIKDTGGELPGITRMMMASSYFVKDNILYIGIGILVLILGYFKGIPYKTRSKLKSALIFKTPVISEVSKDYITARFVRTMGILVNTGLSMLAVLETLEKVVGEDNVSKGIAKARENINKGESLSHSLEQMQFFDAMVTNIISIGEDTGNLGESLLDLAEYYDEKFDAGVSKAVSLIEPIFTLGMGAVIGTILLSAMLPMFDMISSFNS